MTALSEATPEQIALLWLDVLPRVMRMVTAAATTEEAEQGLGVTQFRILKRLRQRPWLGSELAHSLKVTPPTVSAAVDGLVRRGLVERSEASEDRRSIPLRITPSGIHCFELAQQHALAVLARLVEQTSPAERRALAQGLGALSRVMESNGRS